MKYRHRPRGGHIPIKDRLSIHERSKEADGKRFGDFEMDLIVDPDQRAILTLVEKSTNMLLMRKLSFGKQSKPLAKVVRKLLLPYKDCLKTITTDNGPGQTAAISSGFNVTAFGLKKQIFRLLCNIIKKNMLNFATQFVKLVIIKDLNNTDESNI